MLKKHLEWRKKYDLTNILNYKKLEVVEKYFIHELIGYDKEGRPIRYSPCGSLDFAGIIASLKFEDMVKEMIYELESDTRILKEQSGKLGRNIDTCVYVYDLKNLSFAQVTDKRSVRALIHLLYLYLNNYPERLKTAYFLNCPIYFNMVCTIFRTVLPSNVMDKIKIYRDESYKKDLLNLVDDADEWPAFLGGNLTDPDGNPLCLTKIKQAVRPVPEKYFIHKSKSSLSKLPGVQKVTLSRAALHKVKLDVKEPSSYLEWKFQTKCRDIGFGIFYNKMVDGEEQITEIVPMQKIETKEGPETGTLKCERPGTYEVVFDNTYSWIRAKEIYYTVKIVSSEEHDAEIKQG